MKKKLIKVIIDRKKWSRGSLAGNALLVTREFIRSLFVEDGPMPKSGNMCCLGFASLAVGARNKDIEAVGMPEGVDVSLPGLNLKDERWGNSDNTGFAEEAAGINDDPDIDDKEREKKLKALAKENGFNFVFVG